MSLFRKLSALSVVALFAVSVVGFTVVNAQNDTQGNGGSGLQVSPTRTEISAQAGEKKTFTVTLKNITQGEVKAQVFLNDFEADNVSGTPKLITDPSKDKSPYSIKDMLSGLTDVNLKAGETKQIDYNIAVPGNAAPGAYFGAIRYAAVPVNENSSDGDKQVSLTASVAHLVFVEVSGDVVQKIELAKVEPQTADGKKASMFKAPAKAAVEVKNLGNGFSRPFGKVTIYRGSSSVHSYDVNNTDPKGIVLPKSSRTFTDDVKNVKTPGKYKISAGIAYGNGGEVVTYEKSFWYLPYWFLGVIAAVIILLIGGGFFGYKKFIAPKAGK